MILMYKSFDSLGFWSGRHTRPRDPEDQERALHEAEAVIDRGMLFERQRVHHPPYEANTLKDEQDPVDDEREAISDPDEDEPEVCILDGHRP